MGGEKARGVTTFSLEKAFFEASIILVNLKTTNPRLSENIFSVIAFFISKSFSNILITLALCSARKLGEFLVLEFLKIFGKFLP